MAKEQQNKKEKLLEMLGDGMTMLHLDARHPEVEVPDFLKGDYDLRLNLSYRFANVNIQVNDTFVSAVLSFQQTPHTCKIPMEAIWGLSHPGNPEESFHMFPADLPLEIQLQIAMQIAEAADVEDAEQKESSLKESPQQKQNKRPALRLVVDNTQGEEEEEEEEEEEVDRSNDEENHSQAPETPRKRPFLRVISSDKDED